MSDFHCEVCEFAKHHRVTYPLKDCTPTSPFTLIHCDVWGPSRVQKVFGARWFVTFIDDHTHMSWIYLVKKKAKVALVFKVFKNMIENQFQQKIKVLRSDSGTEYYNEVLGSLFKKQGIPHQSSCAGMTQQNGIVERKNRHLLEVARALLFQMRVPKFFWGDAILTACYLINRMPTRVLKYDTPFKILEQTFPTSKHLFSSLQPRIFGRVICP